MHDTPVRKQERGPINAAVLAHYEKTGQVEALNKKQAAALLGVSLRSFEHIRSEGWLPAPIILSQRVLRWIRSEILAALAERAPRAHGVAEPAALAAARAVSKTRAAA